MKRKIDFWEWICSDENRAQNFAIIIIIIGGIILFLV